MHDAEGGGIAFCGETTVGPDDWGADFATGMFKAWAGPGTVLGDMWLAAGRSYWQKHRTTQDAIWPRRKAFHVLTYAEGGLAPLSLYAREYGIDSTTLSDFADDVNRLGEPGSLHPRAPVSAVPRALVRAADDPIALCDQIVAFLHANEATIHAGRLLLDFRTPAVAPFVVTAIELALVSAAPLLDEVVVVE